MKQEIELILREFGDTVELHRDENTVTVRAFLQPVTSKSWQNMEHRFTGLGRLEPGQYLYLGPPEQSLTPGDLLRCREEEYIVRKAECFSVADTGLYQWGLCVRKGGDDPWRS